jgi:hypothetical protein
MDEVPITRHILSIQFDVSLPGAPINNDRPPKIYKIRLTRVAKINTEYGFLSSFFSSLHIAHRILHRFIEGRQSHDNAVNTALMVRLLLAELLYILTRHRHSTS